MLPRKLPATALAVCLFSLLATCGASAFGSPPTATSDDGASVSLRQVSMPAPAAVSPRDTVVAARQAAASSGWRGTKCMGRFVMRPQDFKKCETTTCWLFLQEPPYIVLDERMKTAGIDAEIPFPCASPPSSFSRLHGAAFEIMQLTPAKNATCAFAGPECSFNKLVEFIEATSKANPRIKLAMTGLLLETEGRLSIYVVPSISLMQEEMVVIGLRAGAVRQEWWPLKKMVDPFQDAAWGVFAGVIMLLAVYCLLFAGLFGPRPASIHNLFYFYLGDFNEADIATNIAPPNPADANEQTSTQAATTGGVSGLLGKLRSYATGSSRQDPPSTPDNSEAAMHDAYVKRVSNKLAAYRVCIRLLAMSMGAVVVIFLIFYEMAVVNALFVEQTVPFEKSLKNLSEDELRHFSVQKDAATESVFRSIVDPGGKYSEPYPWGRCLTEEQCFNWVLNGSHVVDKYVGFKTIGTYEIIKRDACNRTAIFETKGRRYKFGAGWLFGNSSGTSVEYRREMDKAILEMQFSDSLRSIVDAGTGSLADPECKKVIERIEIGVIGVAIFFFVAPFLVMALLLVLWQACGGRKMFRGFRKRSRFLSRMSRRDVDDFCRSSRADLRQREGEAFLLGRRFPASTSD